MSFPRFQVPAIALVTLTGQICSTMADGHSHHGSPLLVLNETEVLLHHAPTPPSYFSVDFAGEGTTNGHKGLILLHFLFMFLAFFVALPAAIALRSSCHSWRGFAMLSFYVNIVIGCACSGLYRKLTPNMYEGSKHGSQAYFVIFFAMCLSVVDIFALLRRAIACIRVDGISKSRRLWSAVRGKTEGGAPEYTGLMYSDPEELDVGEEDETVQWNNVVRHDPRHRHSQSGSSEGTVIGQAHFSNSMEKLAQPVPSSNSLTRIAQWAFAIAERSVVFAAYAQVITGIVVYTGGCRNEYINGCLAHLIKGSIFLLYGSVTFARYLGSFSELGWAWNRSPAGSYPTAEFVESSVIFTYGATNVWMERFGAHPGDPYTTKQLQHIGIALMFWFAGVVGMALESKRVRQWLASPALNTFIQEDSDSHSKEVDEPLSYRASFNPFPALVISLTGAVMSAHAQTYLFQVQIHMLWGYFLVAFGVLRCLTYFFLYASPPRSVLPSRPPTEAIGSFFLACGGFSFMLSTEEVTFAAMRQGHDDVMMFLTTTVAIVSLMFTWTFCIVGFKGYLSTKRISQRFAHAA